MGRAAQYIIDSQHRKGQELVESATIDNILDIYKGLASGNNIDKARITPEQEKYLTILLSQYNAQNNLLNTAQQLKQLGLSNSGVLQTGGSTAGTPQFNVSAHRASLESQQRIALVKSLSGMITGMASAGIHGASITAAKSAANAVASQAASSALKSTQKKEEDLTQYWDDMLKVLDTV